MFYCETCRKAEGWPETSGVSKGVCEICGSLGMCWDLPASILAPRRPKQEAPATHHKDGGPAFPRPYSFNQAAGARAGDLANCHAQNDMTLRDWFAGQALIGELASQTKESNHWGSERLLTKQCYTIADAMLAERERTEPQ